MKLPISSFQRQILLLLKKSRNPDSYVAGGIAIQRRPDSSRYSADIDFFHETDEAVSSAYTSDRQTLLNEGFGFDPLISQPSFYRASITRAQDQLKLEWVRDTAFRFFPVVEDDEFGFRLHDVDLAINKCLALANRSEVRDALDILEVHSHTMPFGACIWAACGKDPGFTPELLLDMIQRHAIITPDKLMLEDLREPIDPKKFKLQFTQLLNEARKTISQLDAKDLGCVYLSKDGRVIRDFSHRPGKDAVRHFGTVRGSWPRSVSRSEI